MMNLTSVAVCLSTPKSAEDPLLIFVPEVNVPLALEFIWKQDNNYSFNVGNGYGHIAYSWPSDVVNASSIWDARCN